ncbi:MAG: nucleotidyltransferase domain-containing protein, partial [Synergistaceae bacterium]|nr:nucleotidyltransferase domain-containing protein [Synergistaceae bacterium]
MSMTLRPIVLNNSAGEIDELRVKALETFVDRLKEREGDNLLKVVLFGSVARGDSRLYSDIDVFVL